MSNTNDTKTATANSEYVLVGSALRVNHKVMPIGSVVSLSKKEAEDLSEIIITKAENDRQQKSKNENNKGDK